MKNTLKLQIAALFCMILASCTADEARQMNQLLTRAEQPATSEQKAVLSELETHYEYIMQRFPPTHPEYVPCKFSEIEFTALPYRDFDWEAFDANPTDENLMQCIVPSKGYLFLGKYQDKAVALLDARNYKGKWTASYTTGAKQMEKIFSWLPGVLTAADKGEYYVLFTGMGFVSYVVVFFNGDPEFYNIAGAWNRGKQQFAEAQRRANEMRKKNIETFKKWGEESDAYMKQWKQEHEAAKE